MSGSVWYLGKVWEDADELERILDGRRVSMAAGSSARRHLLGDVTRSGLGIKWAERFRFYGGRCYICGVELDPRPGGNLAWDHVKPISRGGHASLPCNIRPACKWCNGSKGSSW